MSSRGGSQRGSQRGGPRGAPPRGGGGGGGGYRGRGDGRGGGPPRGGGGPPRGGGGFGGRGRGAPVEPFRVYNPGPATIPRHFDSAHEQHVRSLKSLTVDPHRPLRPGYGTLGAPVTLRSNFFAVRLPKGPFYEYEMSVAPQQSIKKLKFRIIEVMEQQQVFRPFLPYIAHDRSTRLVAARMLPQPLSVSFPYVEEGDKQPRTNATVYTVTIKYKEEIDLTMMARYLTGAADCREYNPNVVLSTCNLIMQTFASRHGTRVGQNKYFFNNPNEHPIPLATPGLEVMRGYFLSMRPALNQLHLNVNVCMTAFVQPGRLEDLLDKFGNMSQGAVPRVPPSLVNSIRVTTNYLGYKKRKKLKAIGSRSAAKTFFDCQELGGKVSVADYFKRKYNVRLRRADSLPVVDVAGPQRREPEWLPAELCEIDPKQPFRGKLSDMDTAEMIKYACRPPYENAQTIVDRGLPQLGLSPPGQGALAGFGIDIDPNMAVVPGRVLPPPAIAYRTNRLNARDGSWNILEVKLTRGAQAQRYAVLIVYDQNARAKPPSMMSPQERAAEQQRVELTMRKFHEKCTRSGIVLPTQKPTFKDVALPSDRAQAINVLREAFKGAAVSKFDFILILLTHRDHHIYPAIKRIGDVDVGITTICMHRSKIEDERKQDQIFSNIALKLNVKLGGVNHLLEPGAMQWLTKKKTMMVGVDVTHAGPGSQEGTPSIAAVVASVDDHFVQFPASMRLQRSTQNREMVDELRDMLVERLQAYEKANKGSLPDRVLVFRDGVSEGQFDIVLQEELAQIRDAFQRFATAKRKKYEPRLSIIICGKRHHGRFYPTDSQHAAKNGNTKPGTVVDKGITGVFDYDFYLQAHNGLQGQVRPTHYTVIYDENGLGADELQQGAHTASYLYARATKAVSLIPAAYYADLCCERGRFYLNEFFGDPSWAGSEATGTRLSREAAAQRVYERARQSWGQGIHANMRDRMFYI
ncbi:ribonuclease H-like domain-containing protein [Schizophyllum fasciatum]